MSGNPFLTDFIQMRKSIAPTISPSSGFVSSSVLPQNDSKVNKQGKAKEKTKAKKEIKLDQDYSEVTINHIMEQKPRKRIVLEWLQTRANQLTMKKNA
jgi:hypothetical protein